MSTWQVVTGANLVIAVAYLAISYLVLSGLARTRQLPGNRLGLATGLIFLTCAVHHSALAARAQWTWPSAVWDLLTAAVAIFYLSQRGHFVAQPPAMFEDLRARERQALELNDNIVQGLARVKWALEAKRPDEAHAAADETLAEAQRMVTDLLEAKSLDGASGPARLRREVPAGAGAGPA